MKCNLWILAIFIIFSTLASGAVPDVEIPVSGEIQMDPSAKEGGDVYLIVSSLNSELIKVQTKDSIKEYTSSTKKQIENPLLENPNQKILSLGKNIGPVVSFSLNMKKGPYQISCIVKYGPPPCSEIKINGASTIQNCFPTKGDLICSKESLVVEDKPITNLKIQSGAQLGK